MNERDWLSDLEPAPPAELVTAMRNSLRDATQNPSAEDLLEAAERLLDKVMRTDCEARSSAIDLLTVDALLTHALLIASTDPNAPDDFADQALRRITEAWQ
ncbi:MAG: hypothetical protein ABI408_07020 [Gemmatimonadaceae bacterium]